MNDLAEKVAHVRAATQSREHACHWPRCKRQVPPAKWGCYKHWMSLPAGLRAAIWAAYRTGQEEAGEVSAEYRKAAQAAQDWISEHEATHGRR